MKFENSYIFLEREKKNNEIKRNSKNNVVVINLKPTFKDLLQKSFSNIVFDDEENLDLINSGSFKILFDSKEFEVLFKYHNIGTNYYLDIIIETRKKQECVEVLNTINDILMGKGNFLDKYYISILSYDYISEYYCNKLFPYLNEFERKLRKVLFYIYTLNFNTEYYLATTSKELQASLKRKSNIYKEENVSEEDQRIKYAFYSLEYGDMDKLLFTKYITENESDKLRKFLEDNEDLSKLSDSELREAFRLCEYRNDWERFFGDKGIDENFQKILNNIRIFRNNIAHCKVITKFQYENCLILLKKSIKSLDKAIEIIENKDFINKNIELHEDFLNRIGEIMRDIYNPIIENINDMAQPLKSLNERLSEMVKPIISTIFERPNLIFPEMELHKDEFPKFFDDDKPKKKKEN